MLEHIEDTERNGYLQVHTINLDRFFTFLRDTQRSLQISTFYIENLRFVHFGNDMYRNPLGTGFFHWKGGFLRLPLLFFFYGSRSLGKYKIPEDIVMFDMGITDKESYSLIKTFDSKYDIEVEELFDRRPYYENHEIFGSEAVKSLKMIYTGRNTKFVLFGCGNEGRTLLKYLGDDRVVCFVDNRKYGMIVDGKQVVSFSELKEMDFRQFTLIVTPKIGYSEIITQLENNGIYNYHMIPYTEP